MKAKILIAGIACLVMFFSVSVFAQSTPAVKERQISQQKRIHQGVKEGEITKGEYKKLQKQQKNVRKHKKAAKADGKVTKKERARIHRHQNKASRNIKRKKHNDIDRK